MKIRDEQFTQIKRVREVVKKSKWKVKMVFAMKMLMNVNFEPNVRGLKSDIFEV